MSGILPAIDARRVIADLRELDRLTGGPNGAQRLCWGDGWRRARSLLIDLLGEEGFDLDMPYPTLIPAKGFFKTDIVSLSSFFPHLDDFSLPSHMRITCRCANAALAATMIAR